MQRCERESWRQKGPRLQERDPAEGGGGSRAGLRRDGAAPHLQAAIFNQAAGQQTVTQWVSAQSLVIIYRSSAGTACQAVLHERLR